MHSQTAEKQRWEILSTGKKNNGTKIRITDQKNVSDDNGTMFL